MLNDLVFEATYIKTRNELFDEFYKPCLENSILYDRISGYFGSSVFLIFNTALKTFINNNGKIRIICSPVLKEEDLLAIKNGYDERLIQKIGSELNSVLDELQKEYPNSTLLLSKMISSAILDIKLAVFEKDSYAERLMHDKAGIFSDREGNFVAFRGSINETFKGVSEYGNSESFDVFTSWEDEKDKKRVSIVKDQFESMWNEREKNIRILDIPSVTIDKIGSLISSYSIDELLSVSIEELYRLNKKWYAETGANSRHAKKHQINILNNWEKNNRKGIFEMCTGSGKTFTALCAIRESVFDKNEVPMILVPSDLLFDQWEQELNKIFGKTINILKIGSGNKLNKSKLRMYTMPGVNLQRFILTTYIMASKNEFISNVNWGGHIFLVCDEVHNAGSPQNRRILDSNVGPRIGLSATPKRYFDEVGTNKIIEFFGGILEPRYTIKQAIDDNVLSEYFYFVNEVLLTTEEQEKWNDLTTKINRKITQNKNAVSFDEINGLEMLLFLRADVIKKAVGKLDVTRDILLKNYKEDQRWLIYLDDSEQVKQLMNILEQEDKLRGNIFEYHTSSRNDLDQTLSYFKHNGAILLAINCLDEGVDIPEIDHAIILSSSKNPRQYIQRRGRVLRTSLSKNFAYIYDCLVSPNSLEQDLNKNLSILRGEIARAHEFALNAKNKAIVLNRLDIIMNNNNIDLIEGEFGYEQ